MAGPGVLRRPGFYLLTALAGLIIGSGGGALARTAVGGAAPTPDPSVTTTGPATAAPPSNPDLSTPDLSAPGPSTPDPSTPPAPHPAPSSSAAVPGASPPAAPAPPSPAAGVFLIVNPGGFCNGQAGQSGASAAGDLYVCRLDDAGAGYHWRRPL